MDDNTQLALVRTLLAAERNYLAIERTQLSQLRTGLSLAVLAPSAAATLTLVYSYLPESLELEVVFSIFLGILTIYGIYMTLTSYLKLRKTRATQNLIRERQFKILKQNALVESYFKDIFTSTNHQKSEPDGK